MINQRFAMLIKVQQQREEKLTPLDWSTSDEHPCIVDFSLLFHN